MENPRLSNAAVSNHESLRRRDLPNLLRVVEAESPEAIAAHLLQHPEQWDYFLHRSFSEDLPLGTLTPEALLERIQRTSVDGDSTAQLPKIGKRKSVMIKIDEKSGDSSTQI